MKTILLKLQTLTGCRYEYIYLCLKCRKKQLKWCALKFCLLCYFASVVTVLFVYWPLCRLFRPLCSNRVVTYTF